MDQRAEKAHSKGRAEADDVVEKEKVPKGFWAGEFLSLPFSIFLFLGWGRCWIVESYDRNSLLYPKRARKEEFPL